MTQQAPVITSRPAPPNIVLPTARVTWVESTLEAVQLGAFMLSACVFSVTFEHPEYLGSILTSTWWRRSFEGLSMGLTAAALIYSPMGKRTGAHMNPAVTLTFWRLNKIAGKTALAYSAAHFVGAFAGVVLGTLVLGPNLAAPEVNYAVTVPSHAGALVAFGCEALISFLLFFCVLWFSNHPRLHAHAGLAAATLIGLFVLFEAPYSGMSMNPARTLGSALVARRFDGLWIYFVAPALGMLFAAEVYLRLPSTRRIACAKFNHTGGSPCPFTCNFDTLAQGNHDNIQSL